MQFSPRTLVASIMVSLALAIPAAALAAPRTNTGTPTHHAAGTKTHRKADAKKSAEAKAAKKRRKAERAARLRARARHAHMIRLQRLYEPYPGTVGGGGWPVYRSRFAVPACIVNAESHGYLREHSHPYGSSGIYQIEVGTWEAFGGARYAHFPYQASLLDQSIVASRIWNRGRGASNWSTAAGCGY
jgi:hypothetical protein